MLSYVFFYIKLTLKCIWVTSFIVYVFLLFFLCKNYTEVHVGHFCRNAYGSFLLLVMHLYNIFYMRLIQKCIWVTSSGEMHMGHFFYWLYIFIILFPNTCTEIIILPWNTSKSVRLPAEAICY